MVASMTTDRENLDARTNAATDEFTGRALHGRPDRTNPGDAHLNWEIVGAPMRIVSVNDNAPDRVQVLRG